MPLKITFTLSDNDIRHFRKHMKSARASVSELGEEAIIRAAEGLLAEVADTTLPDFISDRLDKLEVLIDIVRDDRWQLPAADRSRLLAGLAYFSDPQDMIPDHIPGIGYLDDAIMVELIVRELRHDIEGYEDFCTVEGRLKKLTVGAPEDQQRLQKRRGALQRRIRRRNRADRGGGAGRSSSRVSLW